MQKTHGAKPLLEQMLLLSYKRLPHQYEVCILHQPINHEDGIISHRFRKAINDIPSFAFLGFFHLRLLALQFFLVNYRSFLLVFYYLQGCFIVPIVSIWFLVLLSLPCGVCVSLNISLFSFVNEKFRLYRKENKQKRTLRLTH